MKEVRKVDWIDASHSDEFMRSLHFTISQLHRWKASLYNKARRYRISRIAFAARTGQQGMAFLAVSPKVTKLAFNPALSDW